MGGFGVAASGGKGRGPIEGGERGDLQSDKVGPQKLNGDKKEVPCS